MASTRYRSTRMTRRSRSLQNDVDKAFIQLGTRYSVNGGFYPLKPADDGQARADRAAQADGGRGPQDRRLQPGLSACRRRRPIWRRARRFDIDHRRTPGSSTCPATIDENGLKAEIKRWYDGGGTQIAQEINDLSSTQVKPLATDLARRAQTPVPPRRGGRSARSRYRWLYLLLAARPRLLRDLQILADVRPDDRVQGLPAVPRLLGQPVGRAQALPGAVHRPRLRPADVQHAGAGAAHAPLRLPGTDRRGDAAQRGAGQRGEALRPVADLHPALPVLDDRGVVDLPAVLGGLRRHRPAGSTPSSAAGRSTTSPRRRGSGRSSCSSCCGSRPAGARSSTWPPWPSVDTQLYEAARVDGAGRWRQFWHITLPAIRPAIVVMAILTIGPPAGHRLRADLADDHVAEPAGRRRLRHLRLPRSASLQGSFSYATAVGLFKGRGRRAS